MMRYWLWLFYIMPKEIGHYHLHSKHFQFLTIKIQITWKWRGLFTPWFLNIVDISPEVESSSNRKLMRKFIISRIVWKGTGWGLGLTCGRFWNLVSTYSLSCVKLSLTSALILLLMTSSSPAFRWYNRFFYYIMWQCNNFVTFEVMSSRHITWWWLTNTIPLIGFSMLELVQTV